MKKLLTMLTMPLTALMINTVQADSGLRQDLDAAPLLLAKGPPAHAKAHGYRKKQAYQYHYYPDVEVYFDPTRSVYFYLKGGNWVTAAKLPRRLSVKLGHSVDLDMDIASPYKLHREHRVRFPSRLKVKLR